MIKAKKALLLAGASAFAVLVGGRRFLRWRRDRLLQSPPPVGGYGGGGGSFLSSAVTGSFIEPDSNKGDGGAFVVPFAGPVPEPSTWAMMLAGFSGLGAMALRRKRTPT